MAALGLYLHDFFSSLVCVLKENHLLLHYTALKKIWYSKIRQCPVGVKGQINHILQIFTL